MTREQKQLRLLGFRYSRKALYFIGAGKSASAAMYARLAVGKFFTAHPELREPLIPPAVRTDYPLECMLTEGECAK